MSGATATFGGGFGTVAARLPSNRFVMVDTQGVLVPSDWANELHPKSEGFKKIAAKFASELQAYFPPRRIQGCAIGLVIFFPSALSKPILR